MTLHPQHCQPPMLCRRALGWRTRLETSHRLLTVSSWSIIRSGSFSGAPAIHSRSKDNLGRDHGARAYTTTSRLLQTTFGTVTTTAPSQTTIEQLLEPLKDAKAHAVEDGPSSGGSVQLALLLTPSFAQHALDNELPLKAWELLKELGNGATSVETVTAVVDRLPAVTSVGYSDVSEEQEDGQEGLAYLLTPQTQLDPGNLETQHVVDDELIPPLRGKPGNLTFTLLGRNIRRLHGTTELHTLTQVLELPLSQTIFSTSRVSTLIKTTYAQDSEQRLQMQTQQEPKSFNLNLPRRPEGYLRRIHLPLHPLTPPRQVKYSMGNILRQLWHDATPQPASQELEKAVTSYFDALGMDAQAVTVWALIMPQACMEAPATTSVKQLLNMKAVEIKKLWLSIRDWPKFSNPAVQTWIDGGIMDLIPQGAKLCRVLSGGGGWGKKAGLLSLDPDNSYGSAEQGNIRPNFQHGAEVERLDEDTPSAFGQIAEAGDHVMFFLAPAGLKVSKRDDASAMAIERESWGANQIDDPQAFVFVALPSSIDSVPAASTSSTKPTITHTPSVFGMLSEGGMALRTSVEQSSDAASSISTWTKLDVPFAKFIGTKLQTPRLKADVDREFQKAKSAWASWALPMDDAAMSTPLRTRQSYSHELDNKESQAERLSNTASNPFIRGGVRSRPVVRTFPSQSTLTVRRMPSEKSDVVRRTKVRQERRKTSRREQVWAQRRTQKKSEMFKDMASSLGGGASPEDGKPPGLDDWTKKKLAEDVERFFHQR